MNSQTHNIKDVGAPAALPKTKPTDEQILDAMAEIDTPIGDLVLMARIAADVFERMFEQPLGEREGTLIYHFSKPERDAALFAMNDVENRAMKLKAQYFAGRYREEVQ